MNLNELRNLDIWSTVIKKKKFGAYINFNYKLYPKDIYDFFFAQTSQFYNLEK